VRREDVPLHDDVRWLAASLGRGIRRLEGEAAFETIETLRQAGVLDGAPLRALGRYHHPVVNDPHGRPAAEAVASFELAPIGELVR